MLKAAGNGSFSLVLEMTAVRSGGTVVLRGTSERVGLGRLWVGTEGTKLYSPIFSLEYLKIICKGLS